MQDIIDKANSVVTAARSVADEIINTSDPMPSEVVKRANSLRASATCLESQLRVDEKNPQLDQPEINKYLSKFDEHVDAIEKECGTVKNSKNILETALGTLKNAVKELRDKISPQLSLTTTPRLPEAAKEKVKKRVQSSSSGEQSPISPDRAKVKPKSKRAALDERVESPVPQQMKSQSAPPAQRLVNPACA